MQTTWSLDIAGNEWYIEERPHLRLHWDKNTNCYADSSGVYVHKNFVTAKQILEKLARK